MIKICDLKPGTVLSERGDLDWKLLERTQPSAFRIECVKRISGWAKVGTVIEHDFDQYYRTGILNSSWTLVAKPIANLPKEDI